MLIKWQLSPLFLIYETRSNSLFLHEIHLLLQYEAMISNGNILSIRSCMFQSSHHLYIIWFWVDLSKNQFQTTCRSAVHGKGLTRFWSNVEGYNGPVLVLISAFEDESMTRTWIIGALTHQGFENKESFYGTSGALYALSPVFHALLSSGGSNELCFIWW